MRRRTRPLSGRTTRCKYPSLLSCYGLTQPYTTEACTLPRDWRSRPGPCTRRRLFTALASFVAVSGLSAIWASRMKTYDGPVSDHFDGLHFFDPDGSPPKSLGEVLRWQFGPGRERATWPDWAPGPHADTPPARVAGDKVRLSFVRPGLLLIHTARHHIPI